MYIHEVQNSPFVYTNGRFTLNGSSEPSHVLHSANGVSHAANTTGNARESSRHDVARISQPEHTNLDDDDDGGPVEDDEPLGKVILAKRKGNVLVLSRFRGSTHRTATSSGLSQGPAHTLNIHSSAAPS